eukprot:s7_g42.t1
MRFYRLQMNHDMTPELCFEFCIGAGLDLFGLVGEECRCGASLLNKDIWRMEAPRTTGLLLPLAKQLPESEMECPVRVYRWIGPFTSGGSVPEHLQMYVMVRYKFDADVDDTRKEAFRAAAADWRTHTCIAVVEDDNAETCRSSRPKFA